MSLIISLLGDFHCCTKQNCFHSTSPQHYLNMTQQRENGDIKIKILQNIYFFYMFLNCDCSNPIIPMSKEQEMGFFFLVT